MTPQLPANVLACIAKYLDTDDKKTCTYVCKAWSKPIQDSLLAIFKIQDLQLLSLQLKKATKHSIYRERGANVRELDVASSCQVDDEQLFLLQDYFPNLLDLTITVSYANLFEYRNSIDWSLWGTLETLRLNIKIPDLFKGNKEFLYILSCLPCLRQLDVSLNDQLGVFVLELGDIEILHTTLPRLESLSMRVILDYLTNDDLMAIEAAEPAPCLHNLTISLHGIDYRWLCYFSQKYPNLQTIELKTARHVTEIGTHEDTFIQDARKRFISPHNVFEKLENVRIDTKDLGELHQIFWTLFGPSDITPRSIKAGFNTKYSSLDIFDEAMKIISSTHSSTIESLSVTGKFGPNDQQPVLLALDEYARLTTLDLKCNTAKFELDVILDRCMFLEKLRISESTVTLGENVSMNPSIHGLVLIELSKLTISTSVLNYISLRCLSLRFMRVIWTIIYQETPPVPGYLLVDMARTHFERLYLHCVKFISMHPSTLGLPIRLISLSQERFRNTFIADEGTIDLDFDDNNNNNNSTFIQSSSSIEDEDLWSRNKPVWYHMFWDITLPENKNQTATILNEDEVERALVRLSQIHQEDRISSLLDGGLAPSYLLPSNSWEEHIPLGYVDFQCGSIGEAHINTNGTPEDDYWQGQL
ncbi:hypothetical protein CLU79DRAFT_774999 [Phycomyces nitens]|nr:hypothetical protein CLU79DRAFT_774999 [Phycomyces nitens]